MEATLRDIEMRYNMEIEKYNVIILRLQEELTKIRSDIQHNTQEYELLLNIKVKLEAEIAEYRRLLDGEGDFEWVWAEEAESLVETVIITCDIFDESQLFNAPHCVGSSKGRLCKLNSN